MNWRKGSEAGQDLVEYAFVLPVFLLLILGVIEFSLLFFQYNMITNAAREGARAGVVMETAACPQSCLEDNAKQAARTIMAGLDPDKLDIEVTLGTPVAGAIPQVNVTVVYTTSLMTGVMIEAVGGKGDLTLAATATMSASIERVPAWCTAPGSLKAKVCNHYAGCGDKG